MSDNTGAAGLYVGMNATHKNISNLARKPYQEISDDDEDNNDDEDDDNDNDTEILAKPVLTDAELIIDVDKEITGVRDGESTGAEKKTMLKAQEWKCRTTGEAQ